MNNLNAVEVKNLCDYTFKDLLESYGSWRADPNNFIDGEAHDGEVRKHISALQDLRDNGVVGSTGQVNYAAIELVKAGVAEAIEWYFEQARPKR